MLDLVLGAALLVALLQGWWQGLARATCATVGFAAGASLAMWWLPDLVHRVPALETSVVLRVSALALAVLLAATLGEMLLDRLGTRLHAANRLRATQIADSAAGAAAALVVAAVLVWFAGDTARLVAPGEIARTTARSQVLRALDRVVPGEVGRAFAGFRRELAEGDLPRVFEGLAGEPIAEASPPDPRAAVTPAVRAAGASVVKVVADAAGCHREQDGSGWVSAPHRVVTNAHVVAGADRVRVQVGGRGMWRAATVVSFDPRLDLAVLSVDDLDSRPLPVATAQPRGADVVVAGFPGGGDYHLGAARVRSVMVARGTDLTGREPVVRQVYSLYATVRPGNSGGPLLTPQGQVAGTLFASSVDDASTGYALTEAATADMVRAGATDDTPAATGTCTRR